MAGQKPWYSRLARKVGVGLSTLAAAGIIIAGCSGYSGNENQPKPPVTVAKKIVAQATTKSAPQIDTARRDYNQVNAGAIAKKSAVSKPAPFNYKFDKTFYLTDDCPDVNIKGRLDSLGKGFDRNYEQGIAQINRSGSKINVSLHNIKDGNLLKLYENKSLHPSIEFNVDTNGDSRYETPKFQGLENNSAEFDVAGINLDKMKYQVGATIFLDADHDGDLDKVYLASWRSDKSGCGQKMAPITTKKLEKIIDEQAPTAPEQLTAVQEPDYVPTPFSEYASDGYVTNHDDTFTFKDYKWQIGDRTGMMDNISIEDLADLIDYNVKGWASMPDEAKHVVVVKGDLNLSKEKIRSHAATSPAYIPQGYDELVLENAKNIAFHPNKKNHMTAKYNVSLMPGSSLGYRQLEMLNYQDLVDLADALVSGDNAAFVNHIDSNHDSIIQPGEISHIYFVRMNDIRCSGNIAGSYLGRGQEPVYHWDGTRFMISAPYSSGGGNGGSAGPAGPGGPTGGSFGGGQNDSSGMGN